MPRTNNLPKYRKHRASGQAVVTLSGKDHYLGPHGSKASVREYDRLVAEWLAAGRVVREPEHETTVNELLLAYAKHAKKHYRRDGEATGTWEAQKPTVRALRDMYGQTPVTQFGPLKLKAFREVLSKPRAVNRGPDRTETITASRRYINDQIAIVRRIFRWGLSEELVPSEVVTALAAVSGLQAGRTDLPEGRRVEPVADEHVDAVLAFLTPTVRAMVAVQLLTGMRPNEVIQLRPCDVDRSGDVWTYAPQRHKTQHKGKSRVVPIGPKAQEALLPFLDREPERYCFVPAESFQQCKDRRHAQRVTPLSCGNRPGTGRKKRTILKPSDGCYTADSYRRAIHRACDFAKTPRWSPNQLRHSAATKIRAAFGLEQARVVLGHSTTTTTEIYAERDLQAASEVARALG